MSTARRLARNFVTLLSGNVIGQVLFFLALLHLARVVSPAAFGLWNLASAWMLYLMRAGEFGLEVVGLQHVVRKPTETQSWVASVILIRGVLGLALFAVAVSLGLLGFFPEYAAGLVVTLALVLFPMAMNTEWVFEARQDVKPISLGRIAKGLMFYLLVLLFVANAADLEKAALFYLLSVAIPSGVLLYVVLKKFGWNAAGLTVRKGLGILKESMPIGIATILTNYNIFAGTLIAGYMVSGSDLGFFTAAHRLVVFIWAYVIATSHRVLLPTLVNHFHESTGLFERFVQKFFRLVVIVVIPCGITGFVASGHIIGALYPDEYAGAIPILKILLLSLCLALSRMILEISLIASDRQRRYSFGVAILSVGYTVLTPLLILQAGIVGAAMAALLLEAAYCIGLIVACPFARVSTFVAVIWKPMAAAAIALIPVAIASGDQILWLIPVVLMLYFSVLVILKDLSIEDYELLRSVLGRRMADV